MVLKSSAFGYLLLTSTAAAAQLTPIVQDQSFLVQPAARALTADVGEVGTATVTRLEVVQTFTAGQTGWLDSLEFQAGPFFFFDPVNGLVQAQGSVIMSLITGDYLAGARTTVAMGSQSFASLSLIPDALANGLTSLVFDVSAARFAVVPGSRYSVLFSYDVASSPNVIGLLVGSTDRSFNNRTAPLRYTGYAGRQLAQIIDGVAVVRAEADVGFRSFVQGASAVPEPATWGVMTIGFGAIGGAMRTRRRSAPIIA